MVGGLLMVIDGRLPKLTLNLLESFKTTRVSRIAAPICWALADILLPESGSLGYENMK